MAGRGEARTLARLFVLTNVGLERRGRGAEWGEKKKSIIGKVSSVSFFFVCVAFPGEIDSGGDSSIPVWGRGAGPAPEQGLQLVSCGTSVSEKEKQKVWAEYLGKSVIELKGICL